MKHVDQALSNLQKGNGNKESSILQRILKMENDTKTACMLALDMFLVGIDTVSLNLLNFSIYYLLSSDKVISKNRILYTDITFTYLYVSLLPDQEVKIIFSGQYKNRIENEQFSRNVFPQ